MTIGKSPNRLQIDESRIEVLESESPEFMQLLRPAIVGKAEELSEAFAEADVGQIAMLLLVVDDVLSPRVIKSASVHVVSRTFILDKIHEPEVALTGIDLAVRSCQLALLVHLAVGNQGRSISLGLSWRTAEA